MHEWLHGVVLYFTSSGFRNIPDPDTSVQHGYTTGGASQVWLSDLMTGRVPDGTGGTVGLTQAIWDSGTPITRCTACQR